MDSMPLRMPERIRGSSSTISKRKVFTLDSFSNSLFAVERQPDAYLCSALRQIANRNVVLPGIHRRKPLAGGSESSAHLDLGEGTTAKSGTAVANG